MAKAGVVCNIPINTTVLAMGNFVKGEYQNSLSIESNINIKDSILSRFDLVLLIKDDQ